MKTYLNQDMTNSPSTETKKSPSLIERVCKYEPKSKAAQVAVGFTKGAVTFPIESTLYRLKLTPFRRKRFKDMDLQEKAEAVGFIAGGVSLATTLLIDKTEPYANIPFGVFIADCMYEVALSVKNYFSARAKARSNYTP